MAFPQLAPPTETPFATKTTAHLVDLPPTVNAGDLLLVIIGFKAPGAVTTPGGWTLLFFHDAIFSANAFFCYVRVADGTEGGGTVNVVTTNNASSAAHAFRITDWFGALAGVEGSGGFSTAVGDLAPDPPFNTPSWGEEDTLWIAVFGAEDDDAVTIGYPTAYINTAETRSGGGNSLGYEVASATRERNAASESPTAFSLNIIENWIADTIAIRSVSSQALLLRGRREEDY